MAPGSRPVDSEARGGLWLREVTLACAELGAPTAASGEAPLGPPGGEPGRRAVRPIRAAWRRPDRATGLHGKHQLDERRAPSSGARAMKEKFAMKPRFLIYVVTLVAVIAALTVPVVARAADPDWKAVEQALGRSGQMQPGGRPGHVIFKRMASTTFATSSHRSVTASIVS